MAKVTAEEVEELVRHHIQQRGNAKAGTFLIVWRIVVDRILERLEGLSPLQLDLAKQVVLVWGDVVVPASGPVEKEYMYEAIEIHQLWNMYKDLTLVALQAVAVFRLLPCNAPDTKDAALAEFNEVSDFVGQAQDLLYQAHEEGSSVKITGEGFQSVALRCQTILGHILGKPAGDSFKEQYDTSIHIMNEYRRMASIDKSHLS